MAMHWVRFLFASFEMLIRRLFGIWVERSDGVGRRVAPSSFGSADARQGRAGRDEGGVQVVAG